LRVTDLRALRDKYEQILCLRRIHARAKEEPDFVEPDPRPAMAALARRYPGALREIDVLPMAVIERRITELEAAEVDASRIAMWMNAQAEFHRLARGALATKRWLAGRTPTPEIDEAFAKALSTMPERDDALSWADDLAAVAKPPRGRVMDLVYARLAAVLGVDVHEARAAVLPCGADGSHRSRSLRRGRS
jgi:hypothetical protein